MGPGSQTRRAAVAVVTVEALTARPAEKRDAKVVFELRNEPASRSNSLTSTELDWDSHVTWFEERLADPCSRIYILEHGTTPVATVRFQLNASGQTMTHIVVAPEFRGRGVAQSALQMTVPAALRELHLAEIHAVIKKSNPASVAAFKKSGFLMEADADNGELVTMVFSSR